MKQFVWLCLLSIVCFGAKSGAIDSLNVAGNGMLVQKYRLRTIAENIANVSTHMTDTGDPYRKKYVVVVPDKDGVRAAGIMSLMRHLVKYWIRPMFLLMKMGF